MGFAPKPTFWGRSVARPAANLRVVDHPFRACIQCGLEGPLVSAGSRRQLAGSHLRMIKQDRRGSDRLPTSKRIAASGADRAGADFELTPVQCRLSDAASAICNSVGPCNVASKGRQRRCDVVTFETKPLTPRIRMATLTLRDACPPAYSHPPTALRPCGGFILGGIECGIRPATNCGARPCLRRHRFDAYSSGFCWPFVLQGLGGIWQDCVMP
jgi:hypothetical protein